MAGYSPGTESTTGADIIYSQERKGIPKKLLIQALPADAPFLHGAL